jgi:hypothetical protein
MHYAGSAIIMPKTRRLLREEITYSEAKEREVNVLEQLTYYDHQNEFFGHLDMCHHIFHHNTRIEF